MFTVCSTLIWAVLTGQIDWVCHIGTLTPCVEAVALSCIIVTWWSGSGGIHAWSRRPTGFLECFDTVGLVIWPVKIVPEMTYNVSSVTLNPTHSLTLSLSSNTLHTKPSYEGVLCVNGRLVTFSGSFRLAVTICSSGGVLWRLWSTARD